jgi:hypothetical protein
MAPSTQQADVKVGKAEPVRPSSPVHVGANRNKHAETTYSIPGARERDPRKTPTTIVHEPVSENGGIGMAPSIDEPHLLALPLLSTSVVRALSPDHPYAHQSLPSKPLLPASTQCQIP